MKRTLIIFALTAGAFTAKAQIYSESAAVDSTYSQRIDIDSTLIGKSIFSMFNSTKGGTVTIDQSSSMKRAVENQIATNRERRVQGFRVRIYSDNKQNSRTESAGIAARFAAEFPGMAIYQQYTNPFFKVTVGNFRTKIEAQRFADAIESRYPSAYIVRESIIYPSL